MSRRVSYHDVAARATADVPRDRLARAIERLSASYREGKALSVHRSAEGRAAYLVHVLPAHVCDQKRLFLDELERELRPGGTLRVVALGAGPGTEAIALADSWATLAARDGAPPGETLRVDRVDRVREWDEAFASLERVSMEALREIDPGCGSAWKLDAPASIACDLAADPLPDLLRERLAEADLVLAANLLSELEPRATATLPARFLENLAEIARSAKSGSTIVFLDRAHAPGLVTRLESAISAIAAARACERSEVFEREVRCACSLTRATKALYSKVRLPTTKVEDRPIASLRTAFALVRVS